MFHRTAVLYTNHLFTDGTYDPEPGDHYPHLDVSPLYDDPDAELAADGSYDSDEIRYTAGANPFSAQPQPHRSSFSSSASLYVPLSAVEAVSQQSSRPPSRLGTPRSLIEQ